MMGSGRSLCQRAVAAVSFPAAETNEAFDDLSSAETKELKVSSAMDGEIVALIELTGRAFYSLMKRKWQVIYYAFDIIWLNGLNLRELPLVERSFLSW